MNNKPFIKKIGTGDYVRPKVTKTEKLTPEQIETKLVDYVEIDVKELMYTPLGTHIRYFKTEKDGSKKFCPGGMLQYALGLPKFFYLSNSDISWCVQTEGTVIFRHKTPAEMKEEINADAEEYQTKIVKIQKKREEEKAMYDEDMEALKKQLAELKDDNKKMMSFIKKQQGDKGGKNGGKK